ncbi:SMI1/KNR4 family protein [Mucilaginibacter terrigena]|uniref:SMI1/KNR4 family protein n=1 Tax=Mucilaginibacter terrigena TaxID=2492395 RepID=A0A4Q5LML2_9SPHI|nr:SMI1/KNR4 family protein [Mucilaginibacter terrigena]RYU89216.1 SMI1/KNR4 family protein [Mucilaginibacter terrigena]
MYNTEIINTAIEIFFDTVKRFNKKLYNNLDSGLSEIEIKNFESTVNFKFPPEVFSLYRLKNGFKIESKLNLHQSLLFDNGLFLSVEQATSEYNALYKNIPELKFKLPLFDSGGGDFLLLDCDPNSPNYRKILIWSPPLEIVEPEVIYRSLADLCLTNTRCLTTDVYRYDDNGDLQFDFQKLKAAAILANGRLEYWNKRFDV